MIDRRTLDTLAQLAAAEREYASLASLLDEHLRSVGAVRGRAEEAAAVLMSADEQRARLGAALAEAEREADERRRTLEHAEAEFEAAAGKRDEERRKAAERFVVRARDALAMAERQVALAREALTRHEERVDAAERAVPEIEVEAARLARALAGLPRLAPHAAALPRLGLDGVGEWARTAYAALTVARSSVSNERDALIRQANELGSVALGEPLAASSAAVVHQRVEAVAGAPRRE